MIVLTLNCYNSARYTKPKSSDVGRPVGETAVNMGAKKLAPAATHMMTIQICIYSAQIIISRYHLHFTLSYTCFTASGAASDDCL